MNIFEALILGIVQGITEFLPISSSGHLVLGESFLGLEVEKLKSFDVVVHLGTLTAIVIYFWKDIVGLFYGFIKFLGFSRKKSVDKEYQKLIIFILIGTIPAVIAGLFFEDAIDFLFRSNWYVGIWMIIIGLVFILSEEVNKNYKKEKPIKYRETIVIGIAQAIALIPGVSRSGSTIAAGLFQGISREKGARFSFLLAIPAIFGAGLLTFLKVLKNSTLSVDFIPLIVGFITSAVSGFAAVYFLMKYLKKHTLKAFSIYLFILGGIVLLIEIF